MLSLILDSNHLRDGKFCSLMILCSDIISRTVNTRDKYTLSLGTVSVLGLVLAYLCCSLSSVSLLFRKLSVHRHPQVHLSVPGHIRTKFDSFELPICRLPVILVYLSRRVLMCLLTLVSTSQYIVPLVLLHGLLFLLLSMKYLLLFAKFVKSSQFSDSKQNPYTHYISIVNEMPMDQVTRLEPKSYDPASSALQGLRSNKLYFRGELEGFIKGEDTLLIPDDCEASHIHSAQSFTAYKPVDRRVRPISGPFPQEALVQRSFPHNPLDGLPILSRNPPDFIPTKKITLERLKIININGEGYLWPEEEKLFAQVMVLNETALAFEETDRGTLREDYFSPYIMPTVPHTAWEEKNIPIPPGIKDKVIELLKHKMDAGVYEHCQSAYRSKWFCVLKKSGKL